MVTRQSMCLVLITMCFLMTACGLTKEQIQAEEKRIASIKAYNTDLLIDTFISEIWEKPISSIRTAHWDERWKEYRHYKKTFFPMKKCFRYRSSYSATCDQNAEKIYGESKIGFNFNPSDNFEHIYNDSGFGFKVGVEFKFDHPYWPKPEFENASVFKEKLLARGVPLLFCFEGFLDKYRVDATTTKTTTSEEVKSFHCTLSSGWLKKHNGAQFFFKTDYGDLSEFHITEMGIREHEKNKSLSEIHERRLKNKEDIADTEIALQHEYSYRQALSEKKVGEWHATDAQWSAYLRERKEARANSIANALSSSVGKSFGVSGATGPAEQVIANDPLDQIREQTMREIHLYQQGIQSARQATNSQQEKALIPSTAATNSTINNNFENNSSTTSSAVNEEKQNCINAGKKWMSTGGCDYSSRVTVQGWKQENTVTANPSEEKPASHNSPGINKAPQTTTVGSSSNTANTRSNNKIDDNCCFDVGLSDKAYGDALDKARGKADKVCRRKGVDLVPVNLYHEQVSSQGWKYKSRLTYQCGIKPNK